MLKGHNIICFSSDWHQDPLSKHHIMGRLAKHNRVLWINSIGMRTPTVSRKDFAKIGKKLRSFSKSIQKVDDNLFVVSPLVVPFHGSRLAGVVNRRLLTGFVRSCQRKIGLERPILWSFLPNVGGGFGGFGEKLSLYYITDDFTQFTGHPSKAIGEMEASLIDRCDVVIASASRLAEKKARNGDQIRVVSHGVNREHFAKALTIARQGWPDDIRDIEKPVIGFYGEINDWLDLRMLAEAARKKPGWSFVLLGRVAVEVGNINYLKDLPNVHLLGQKKFEELPFYCAAFDVALIPMKMNELTLNVNPLKLREYLAAGVPVVSAPLPEVLPYGDVVKFAKSQEELIAAVEGILKEDRVKLAPALTRRVACESWEAKVEEISDIIEKALAGKKKSSHTTIA
jgi:glycosyltransferase involved in cell wall biosynthesis